MFRNISNQFNKNYLITECLVLIFTNMAKTCYFFACQIDRYTVYDVFCIYKVCIISPQSFEQPCVHAVLLLRVLAVSGFWLLGDCDRSASESQTHSSTVRWMPITHQGLSTVLTHLKNERSKRSKAASHCQPT